MTQTPNEQKANYTSVPNIIYDGYPELKAHDRHVASALLRHCWKPGWYQFSMRDIGSISGVPHNLMRSIEGREGILDRLKRITGGIFDFLDGVTINPRTGKEGRPQTYISIAHDALWQANAMFFAEKKLAQLIDPLSRDLITVSEGYSHPTKGRRKVTVSNGYTDVSEGYSSVSGEYTTVSGASTNAPVIPEDTIPEDDKHTTYDGCATATPSPAVSFSDESKQPSYSREDYTEEAESIEQLATGKAPQAAVQPSMFNPSSAVIHLPQREAPVGSTSPASKSPATITTLPVGKNAGKGKGKGATTKEEKTARTPKIEVVLTADGALVAIEWDKARGPNKFTTRTKQFIEDANALALTCKGNLPTTEKLREARGYLFASNPKFYRDIKRGGITLHDVVGAWAAFEDSLELQEAGGLDQPAASQGQRREDRRPDQERTSLIVPDDVAEQTKQQNFERAVAKFESLKATGKKLTTAQYNWAKRNGMDMTGVELEEDFSMGLPARAAAN